MSCYSKTPGRRTKGGEMRDSEVIVTYMGYLWPFSIKRSFRGDSGYLSQTGLELENGWLLSEKDWKLELRGTYRADMGYFRFRSFKSFWGNSVHFSRWPVTPKQHRAKMIELWDVEVLEQHIWGTFDLLCSRSFGVIRCTCLKLAVNSKMCVCRVKLKIKYPGTLVTHRSIPWSI